MADVPRAPSRIGFMRPSLRREDAAFRIEYAEFADTFEDHLEDESWGTEVSGGLVYPSSSHADNHEDLEEMAQSQPDLALKSSLPSQTMPVSSLRMRMPSYTASSPIPILEEEGPVIPDHGLSRSALSHLKEFWSTRRNEWSRKESVRRSPMGVPSVYGFSLRDAIFSRFAGATSPFQSTTPTTLNTPSTDVANTVLVNASTPIYPRTGDLMRLRDARFATMDRAFSNMPLYSIAKMLFLHDMLARSGCSSPSASSRSSSPAPEPDERVDYTEEYTRLKIDADEGDGNGDGSFVDISLLSSGDNETLVERSSKVPLNNVDSASLSSEDEDLADPGDEPRDWEVDWSARWRVLLQQSRSLSSVSMQHTGTIDEPALLEALHSVAANPDLPSRIVSSTPSPSPTRPRFFIPEEDEDDDYFSQYDIDDDEDYGRLLRRPVLQYGTETEYFPVYDTEFSMVHY